MSQAQSLLAACGGDTVKLFDVSVESGDPCTFQYSPAQASQVHCVKWNHTNLVVASAGEDGKISLWMKNGQVAGVLPQAGVDGGDSIEESMLTISFSNKGSRYLCSGGTGKVVRVWDLQRKRCIKWLKGHTDTITGVMYNSKDEHLASISVKGDLILHNLSSGTRAAELKDPHGQVLRVLEYSRLSRHTLVTAGDDGSVHLWDTTGRSPKVSWTKQHSAPTTGVAFSPSNDKVIVSVGLDKKLYTFDPGMKKPVYCVPCEAPFSSLAFKDDGFILAAGTNSGRVVFYDARGKPQPFTILRAYGTSEAVTSLCWQRSNPIPVNESNCTMDVALLGVTGEDSVLMPDPLPSSVANKHVRTVLTSIPVRTAGHLPSITPESPLVSGTSVTGSGLLSRSLDGEETPISTASYRWNKSNISRLQTPHNAFSVKDDMEVFSPLVDVQPITPSVSSFWGSSDELKKEIEDRKSTWGSAPPGEVRRFPSIEEIKDESRFIADLHVPSLQEDLQTRFGSSTPVASTPPSGISPKDDRSPSITPPEAWGGDGLIDKVIFRQLPNHSMSRFAVPTTLSTSSTISMKPASTSSADVSATLTTESMNLASVYSAHEPSQRTGLDFPIPDQSSRVVPVSEPSPAGSLGGRESPATLALDATSASSSFILPTRKLMPYTDRIVQTSFLQNISPSSGDGTASSGGSPKQKRALLERNEDRGVIDGILDGKRDSDNGHNLRSDAAAVTGANLATSNGHLQLTQRSSPQQEHHHQGPPSFALQLVQRTLEESLGAVQRAIHEDVQNLHLELLRQFHIQQTEMAAMMDGFLAKQADLLEEIQNLRRENQQLRQFF